MDEGYLNIGLHIETFYKVFEVVDRILVKFRPWYVYRSFLSLSVQRPQSHFVSIPENNSWIVIWIVQLKQRRY
jgi:hypothetical protein